MHMLGIEADIVGDNLCRLTRAAKINVLTSGFLKRYDDLGNDMNPLWRKALLYTQSLSRLSIFWAYTEIMASDHEESIAQAQIVLKNQQVFFRHEILNKDLVADQPLRLETERFVSSVQAGFYANRH